MFNRNFRIALVISVLLAFLPALTSAENSITLDRVLGDQFKDGQIMYDHSGSVVFLLRMTVDPGISDNLRYIGHGFRCYTTGDVTTSHFEGSYLPLFPIQGFDILHFNASFGPDTATFDAISALGSGIPPGYDQVSFGLTVSILDADLSTNPTFCFDSVSMWPNTSEWRWLENNFDDVYIYPTWDGPHCFSLVRCCDGMTGNINDDPNDDVDISDLTALVNYLFGPHTPIPCVDEADVTGDGAVDISDVTYFIKYIFMLGDPPAPCF